MAQVLLVRDREREEGWGVVWGGAWAGWEEVALGQVPAGIVCAPVVEQEFLIRQVLPATT